MLQHTGMLINFGFVVIVGFVVGTAVTGQIFYNFTLDNLRYFGVFKAMEDVENALAGFYAQQEREKQLAASVTAYADARSLANERYTKGLTTFLTVLVNETSLYSAQVNLSKARANTRTELVALYKALGGGWNVPAAAEEPRSEEKRPPAAGRG